MSMDLADAVAKRPPLGKFAYQARVRRVVRTKKAAGVAANCAGKLREVCRAVVNNGGRASGY